MPDPTDVAMGVLVVLGAIGAGTWGIVRVRRRRRAGRPSRMRLYFSLRPGRRSTPEHDEHDDYDDDDTQRRRRPKL